MRSRAIKGHHGESPNRLLSTHRHTDRRTRTPPSSLQPPHRPAPLPYTSNHHRKTDGRLPLRNQGGKAEAGSTDEDPGMLKSLSRSTPPIPAVQTSLRSAAQFAAARTSHPTPERCSPPCRRGARLTQGGGGGRGGQCFVTIRGLAMENLRCKPAGTIRSRSQPSDSCSEHPLLRRLPSFPTRRRIASAAATMIVGRSKNKSSRDLPKMAQRISSFDTRGSSPGLYKVS